MESQVARRKTSFLMGGPDIYRKYLLVSGKNGDRDADLAELFRVCETQPLLLWELLKFSTFFEIQIHRAFCSALLWLAPLNLSVFSWPAIKSSQSIPSGFKPLSLRRRGFHHCYSLGLGMETDINLELGLLTPNYVKAVATFRFTPPEPLAIHCSTLCGPGAEGTL